MPSRFIKLGIEGCATKIIMGPKKFVQIPLEMESKRQILSGQAVVEVSQPKRFRDKELVLRFKQIAGPATTLTISSDVLNAGFKTIFLNPAETHKEKIPIAKNTTEVSILFWLGTEKKHFLSKYKRKGESFYAIHVFQELRVFETMAVLFNGWDASDKYDKRIKTFSDSPLLTKEEEEWCMKATEEPFEFKEEPRDLDFGFEDDVDMDTLHKKMDESFEKELSSPKKKGFDGSCEIDFERFEREHLD